MSAPAENTLPAPVSTITRTPVVSLSSSKTEISSSTNSRDCALTGGASIVTTATWSLISVLISRFSILRPALLFDELQAQLIRLPQRSIEIDGALEVKADIALIGETHCAEQMHGAPANREGGVAGARLGGEHGERRGPRIAGFPRPARVGDGRPRK